jgi:glycosyltransferase involved in cell wall biosynthesis
MALGRGVITPDCIGNSAYCRPGENCLMPIYVADALAAAARILIDDGAQLQRLAAAGLKTASQRSIERERNAYHALLASYLGQS